MPILKPHAESRPPAAETGPDDGGGPDILLETVRSEPSAASRRGAARGLGGSPDVAEPLAALLGSEQAPEVREAIVTTLIELGNEGAARGLARYFGSEDPELRNAAVDALRQIGDPAAEVMKDILASPDPDERIFAINVLEGVRHRETAGWLRDVLSGDPDIKVCLAAVEALVQNGDARDEAALRAFERRFPDEPFVAFAVGVACERVAPRATS